MGGLAWAHRARGLPEGDLEGLLGEESQFPGPLTQVEPISGEAFTAGWKSGGSHSLQEKIKATSAATAAAVTTILRWREKQSRGLVECVCVCECTHTKGEQVKRYW